MSSSSHKLHETYGRCGCKWSETRVLWCRPIFKKMVEIYITSCPNVCLVNSFILYDRTNHPPSTAHGNRQVTFRRNLARQLIGTFTSRKRSGRKRSLPIGTASPHLFHTLQKISGRVKVSALRSEKKKETPSGRGKETKYKCKQCDLPLCRVGCFWNTTSSEMWRCKIRWVGYYMHTFITNKLKKDLSFCLF